MNDFIIRRTNSVDEDFSKLIRTLDEELNLRNDKIQLDYDKFNNVESIQTVVIAYEDEKAVACGCFKPYDDVRVEVKRMFVEPLFRGKGLSKQILSEIEKWAQEIGYVKAILETGKKQTEAISLYQNCGYQQIENYGQYKNFPNSLCFEKEL